MPDILKKFFSFIPLFSILPVWLQGLVILWLIFTVVLVILIFPTIYKEYKRVLNVTPVTNQSSVPYLHDQNNALVTFRLNISTKQGHSFQVQMINIEMKDIVNKTYSVIGSEVNGENNLPLELPVLLDDKGSKAFIIKFPIIDKNKSQIEGRINFIPYEVQNKTSIEFIIRREDDCYQVAMLNGNIHIEFGRAKVNGQKSIKFIKKYRHPPEVNASNV